MEAAVSLPALVLARWLSFADEVLRELLEAEGSLVPFARETAAPRSESSFWEERHEDSLVLSTLCGGPLSLTAVSLIR